MEGTFNIKVEKKSGALVDFDASKIHEAVKKSASRVLLTFTDIDLKNISDEVIKVLNSNNLINLDGVVTVPDMHKAVELSLDNLGFESVAKSYRDYRNYKEDYVKMMEVIDNKLEQLKYKEDTSNANSDSTLISTKRSIIASELGSELYKRFFLSDSERQAMSDGYIYIHDRGSRLFGGTHNCCLFNIANVMKGGFFMGGIDYTEPGSLSAAMAVMGDIAMSSASQQYGGYSFTYDDTLAPYAEKSYNKYMKEYKDLADSIGGEYDESKADEWAYNKVKRDAEQGFQAHEHLFNSVNSSRGDYIFVTGVISSKLTDNRWSKLIAETALKVRMGGQGKEGFKRPVLFPKLVFLYDEEKHGKGKALEDLFELAVKCNAKTMYPDFVSLENPEKNHVSEMYKLNPNDPIFPMGCRSFLSPWWKKGGMYRDGEDDIPVFLGRFNIGVVTLNLPMIYMKSKTEGKDFYEVLNYYLELVRSIHRKTYEHLGKLKASSNPIGFTQGGFLGGNLNPNDYIAPLLKSATASFGYIGLNELNRLYNGKSLFEDGEFPLEVMTYINDVVLGYKNEDKILYSLYGTPSESYCGQSVRQFREKFGEIEGVSDREYFTNSFHCHVSEEITQVEKMDSEYRFWDKTPGGRIQYVRIPNEYNIEANRVLIRRAMAMGLYFGLNRPLGYCTTCGFEFTNDNDGACPKCGSEEVVTLQRVCGYLGFSRSAAGSSRLNDSKLAEVHDRKSM